MKWLGFLFNRRDPSREWHGDIDPEIKWPVTAWVYYDPGGSFIAETPLALASYVEFWNDSGRNADDFDDWIILDAEGRQLDGCIDMLSVKFLRLDRDEESDS